MVKQIFISNLGGQILFLEGDVYTFKLKKKSRPFLTLRKKMEKSEKMKTKTFQKVGFFLQTKYIRIDRKDTNFTNMSIYFSGKL